MLFAPFATDIAHRVAELGPSSVLETAAGTGAVTRQLAGVLPESTRIVATDLNEGHARPRPPRRASLDPSSGWWPTRWQLPFDDESFDVVVCQFGVMFFPDRVAGFAEARRVLAPGGTFVFSTWDSLEHNDFATAVDRRVRDDVPG